MRALLLVAALGAPVAAQTTTIGGIGSTTISGSARTTVGLGRWMLLFGDSKTAPTAINTWMAPLVTASETRGGSWQYYDVGVGGATVATLTTALTATLAAMPVANLAGDIRVLINLGVNDMLALPAEATWTANYLTILDAIHEKWPTARVYLMRPWARTQDANSDTVAGWVAAIVAARSSFVSIGPDERIWLKGADDGATMTTDGTHYSAAGNTAAATQWAAVLWP